VAVVQEAYVKGVSTRKVDRLVEALGLAGVSKDTVSRLCRGLDEQVTAFRERPLDGRYPYLWLDAKVEKVRAGGRVEHRALVVAYGVDHSGQREVIGLDVGAAETEAFWREFLRSLVRRGLAGVQLVISDAHEGLKQAIAQVLSAPWQRCTVHFLRDALGHCPKDLQQLVGAAIRPIFRAGSLEEAQRLLEETVAHLEARVPKVARLLLEAETDLLAFYAFPAAHRSKLRSTDESFKALVALPAGPSAVRLGVGRGRPRSEEQGLGAGSPAAQLCPLEGPNVVPQWWRPRPCLVAAWLAASTASRLPAGGRRAQPARPVPAHAGGPLSANTRPRCPSGPVERAVPRGARASAASCRSARAGRRRSPRRW
jgi:Transposase, Mutator family